MITTSALEFLKKKIEFLSKDITDGRFNLTALWKMDMLFRPNLLELGYVDTVVVAQTIHAGASFCITNNISLDSSIIGMDVRTLPNLDRHLQIACLDAAYGEFPVQPDLELVLEGCPATKAYSRANIVVDEVARISSIKRIEAPTITTVGTVGTMVSELITRGYNVNCSDLDPHVIGKKICGIEVEDGSYKTLKLIENTDIAIVTAMTIATGTFDDIMRVARENSTSIVIFSQTGSNFMPYLMNFGITSIVAEYFPFYMFPGRTPVKVFREDKSL